MFKDKSTCVVIPAHNEAKQIETVILTVPEYVDKIVVVDDASTDRTAEIVTRNATLPIPGQAATRIGFFGSIRFNIRIDASIISSQ